STIAFAPHSRSNQRGPLVETWTSISTDINGGIDDDSICSLQVIDHRVWPLQIRFRTWFLSVIVSRRYSDLYPDRPEAPPPVKGRKKVGPNLCRLGGGFRLCCRVDVPPQGVVHRHSYACFAGE